MLHLKRYILGGIYQGDISKSVGERDYWAKTVMEEVFAFFNCSHADILEPLGTLLQVF